MMSSRVFRLARANVVCCFAALAFPVAISGQEPALYTQALTRLQAADTVAALASLRRLTEEEPEFTPGWGLLGRVLAAGASGVSTDFQDRREADIALRRALHADPENPSYLLALGLLMRKQQIVLDARRLIDRAIRVIEEEPERLTPAELAELWYQRGLYHEDAYLDTRHLVFAPQLPVGSACVIAPTFCLNFSDPVSFNEQLRTAADLSEYGEDDYDRMLGAFRRALDVHPTHSSAFRRLVVHLVERGQYGAAFDLAREFHNAAADDAWGHIMLGLLYQRSGRDSLAEVWFDRGLARAGPEIAAHYRDVAAILRRGPAADYSAENELAREQIEEALWRKSDPLYLTTANEFRAAYRARVAFADVRYEDISEGTWGSETEQGTIYVRYGPPLRIWQVARDASREIAPGDFEVGLESQVEAQGGGRWIFWNYGWSLPNFIFQKPLRYRRASHQFGSYSKLYEEEARHAQPAHFELGFEVIDYPVQAARFRGSSDDIVELEIYSNVPVHWLWSTAGADSLDAGVFVFTGPEHRPVLERRLRLPSAIGHERLTYTLELSAGRYALSVEARARGGAAAVRREEVEVRSFAGDSLGLSDIVLARSVTPLKPDPAGRRDFAVRAVPWLAIDAEDPLAFYWEVYGLTPDDEGYARYQVSVTVTGPERGVLARVVGVLGDVLGLSGDDSSPELTYERVIALAGDRVPEYLAVELPEVEPGEYLVRVRVDDRVGGRSAESRRRFSVRRE